MTETDLLVVVSYTYLPPIDHLHRALPIPNVVHADVHRAVRSVLQFSHESVPILEGGGGRGGGGGGRGGRRRRRRRMRMRMRMPRRRRRRRRRLGPSADEAEIRNAGFEAVLVFGHDLTKRIYKAVSL